MTKAQGDSKAKNARTARGLAVSRVVASKKFGGYKPEEEKAVRKADVKEDEVLKQLKDAWEKFKPTYSFPISNGNQHEINYTQAVSLIENLRYSSRDVELFSLALAEFRDEPHFADKAEDLLEALINKGEDKEFRIHTKHMGILGIEIGIKLEKEGTSITIEGDGCLYMGGVKEGFGVIRGDSYTTAAGMRGGKLIVEGSVLTADGVGGGMKGGEVIVKGDVLGCIGSRMEGGIIRVYGNATGKNVTRKSIIIGHRMKGGEIYLYGDYAVYDYGILFGASFDSVIHGKIYHKGELIVDR